MQPNKILRSFSEAMKSEHAQKKKKEKKKTGKELFLSYEHIHILYTELLFREKYYADFAC